MRTDGQRRSDNYEDRGRGSGGMGGGGLPGGVLFAILRRIGLRGILIVGVVLAGIWFFAPPGIKNMVFGALIGGVPGQTQTQSEGSTCDSSPDATQACDFSRAILGSTEDVWAAQFQQGRLPRYNNQQPGAYQNPTLVVYSGAVGTEGCGNASSEVGPFYCPGDHKLYVDPSFYDLMRDRLRAPGDFAQAYVIAHEVGHHVQNLIGATQVQVQGESQNQTSVRVELQADCFAGLWANHADATRQILEQGDVEEALNAASQIGDDALQRKSQGTIVPESFTHGTSAQRVAWFKRGLQTGSVQQCNTFEARGL